jgi:hypothetical protein
MNPAPDCAPNPASRTSGANATLASLRTAAGLTLRYKEPDLAAVARAVAAASNAGATPTPTSPAAAPPLLITFLDGRLPLLEPSMGTQRIAHSANAGGSSVLSEALSFEVLRGLLGLRLLATEMQIRWVAHE